MDTTSLARTAGRDLLAFADAGTKSPEEFAKVLASTRHALDSLQRDFLRATGDVTVYFSAPWSDPVDSWAKACRGYARAMSMAGLSVWIDSWHRAEQLDNVKYLSLDPDVALEVEGLLATALPPYLSIFGTSTGSTEHHRYPQILQNFLDKTVWPRVFYTTFERTRVQADVAAAINRYNGVWVPCSANRDALVESGVRDEIVRVFPHVHYSSDPLLSLPLPVRSTTFYWIGYWEPRKAPDNLIRAFMRAFKPGEARLVLKTTGTPRPLGKLDDFPETAQKFLTEERKRSGWSSDDISENIEVISSILSRRQMLALHDRCDVYVSASRGEGFDLPSYEAKLAGRRVVTTDSGGPRDFLTENDTLVPRTGTVPAHPKYLWGRGAEWADYDLDELVAALQAATEKPPLEKRDDMTRFLAENVGTRIRDWFKEILAERS